MKTVKQIIDEIRADIEIRPTPLDEQLDELLKSHEKEIDELSNTFADTCETLAWYINERQRLLKVIEYSKPNEGLQRTIQKALERPHGEWLSHYEYCKKHELIPSGLIAFWWCNNCEQGVEIKTNFCPNCGADMRKKVK